MGYWDETDKYLRSHGGVGPKCLSCGRAMVPQDDHGRFTCFCGGGGFDIVTGSSLRPRPVPQVDTTGMTNAEKARVPPINRLDSPVTKAEQAFFRAMRNPDSPEYQEAKEALEEEKRKAAEGEDL